MHIPYNPSCQAGPSSGSCFYSKLPKQQQIINIQGTAVPQCFPDIWFYLQSETLHLNLGMEQEVRFQSSKINPLGGSNEARFLSLQHSLEADGSREPVLSSKAHSGGALRGCAQLLSSLKTCWSSSPLYQLLLLQPWWGSHSSCWTPRLWREKYGSSYCLVITPSIPAKGSSISSGCINASISSPSLSKQVFVWRGKKPQAKQLWPFFICDEKRNKWVSNHCEIFVKRANLLLPAHMKCSAEELTTIQ